MSITLLKKVVRVLRDQPGGLWIREIARQTKEHPETIRRLISKYPEIFEDYADLTAYNINLKFIRLRKDYAKHYSKYLAREVLSDDDN